MWRFAMGKLLRHRPRLFKAFNRIDAKVSDYVVVGVEEGNTADYAFDSHYQPVILRADNNIVIN